MKSLDRISGYAHVALHYGLEEAIFLDSIIFWYKENRANQRNYRDGRWWTFNSISAFEKLFPWWSGKQLRRIIASCKEKGAILSGNYSSDQRDRTLWYTPSDELLTLYGIIQEGNCNRPFGQMQQTEGADTFAQMGTCIKDTCNNHVETNMNNPLPPDKPSDEVSPVFSKYAGEDGELRERLEEFRESRKRKKKPLQTRRAAIILTGKLDKLSGGDRARKLALLDNAILHGWDSVYPLKGDEAPPGTDCPQPHRRTGRLAVDENGEEVVVFD